MRTKESIYLEVFVKLFLLVKWRCELKSIYCPENRRNKSEKILVRRHSHEKNIEVFSYDRAQDFCENLVKKISFGYSAAKAEPLANKK